MLNYPPHTEIINELYGAMQTFRGLGFPSDNLYLGFGILATDGPYEGRKCVGVSLLWRDKRFNCHVAPVKNDKKFARKWVKFSEAANTGVYTGRLERIYMESFARRNAVALIMALDAKGITPPLDLN
jgi:hypothetical protein